MFNIVLLVFCINVKSFKEHWDIFINTTSNKNYLNLS